MPVRLSKMDENIKAFIKLHQPECQAQPMVWEVWEDGEITLTKGGELYGCRNLHCIWPGDPTRAKDPMEFPLQFQRWNHARIMVESELAAQTARAVLFGVKDIE